MSLDRLTAALSDRYRLESDPGRPGLDVLPGDSLLLLFSNRSGARERIMVIANFLSELRTLTGSPRADAPMSQERLAAATVYLALDLPRPLPTVSPRLRVSVWIPQYYFSE